MDDLEDPVIDMLVQTLTNTNVKVRLAVLDAVAPVQKAIEPLVNRVRDVDDKVRLATCKKFTCIPAQNLTVSIIR